MNLGAQIDQTQTAARPVSLTRFPGAMVPLRRYLSARRVPIVLPHGGEQWSIDLTLYLDEPPAGPWLYGAIAKAPVALALSFGDARRLLGLAIEGGDAEMIAIALEATLADALETWERQGLPALRCTRFEDGPPPEDGQWLMLTVAAQRSLRLPLWLSDRAAQRVAKAMKRLPEYPYVPDGIPVPVSIVLASTALTLAELKSAGVGDAISIEPDQRPYLTVGQDYEAAVAVSSDTATLTTNLQKRKAAMTNDLSTDNIGQLDDLDVRVTFVANQIDMHLGELRRLGAGAVLSLPGSADGRVDIHVNGRKIGAGRLVDIGGQSGVEIIALFDD